MCPVAGLKGLALVGLNFNVCKISCRGLAYALFMGLNFAFHFLTKSTKFVDSILVDIVSLEVALENSK